MNCPNCKSKSVEHNFTCDEKESTQKYLCEDCGCSQTVKTNQLAWMYAPAKARARFDKVHVSWGGELGEVFKKLPKHTN